MSGFLPSFRDDRARGFALVLVIVLLGLLVLVTYALALLGRIETQSVAVAEHRQRARQHALAALHLAIGSLQAHAGDDAGVITGMAGITGTGVGSGNPGRHWTGVWPAGGATPTWLVSGIAADPFAGAAAANSILIVGSGTLGVDAPEREHVRVPWIPARDAAGGRLAWWVGDGGVKLSARVGTGSVPHALDAFFPALDPASPELGRLRAYGQLAFIPGADITPTQLRAHFQVVTVVHESVDPASGGAELAAGRLNVNSNSARYWQGVAATYDRISPPDERLGITAETFGARMSRGFAGSAGPGKFPGGPFLDAESFLGSQLLVEALAGSGVEASQFGERMRGRLVVRSDTFVVRAYGDSLNPADASVVESAAWCEATVQRTIEPMSGFGRRFVVRSFRWLGPDDL